ncbi:MAG: glycosyltransferase [Fibrobacter sp.]|jgi:glycosyltransferase involved in cell wall biosynthesis|nr:glycosyltransferase [Fibrobacter sp.]
MTASSSTKYNANFDTRPPISGRETTSSFPVFFSIKHKTPNIIPSNFKTCWIPFWLVMLTLINIPYLLSLRKYLKEKRKSKKPDDIRVLYYADCLDEVNGIANNLRHVVSFMKDHGYKVALAGNAFNTRERGVVENHFVFLLPRFFSMEQLGYANSELAMPWIRPAFRLVKRYPIDVISLETPSPGAWLVGICGKIAGIKVVSHYRTDVPGYVKILVKSQLMNKYVLKLIQLFYHFTRPVISPTRAYKDSLIKTIRVPEKDVVILRRGIPLEDYHPEYRGQGTWEKFGGKGKVRFLYVGRISKEKDLPFLENIWKEFRKENKNAELMFTGDGWYLEELKQHFADCPEVSFSGNQGGETLSGIYADADFFIFPSGTDTFGNVVVEAIASGTPAIVTDRGGPQDIIFEQNCGYILPFENERAWVEQLNACTELCMHQPEEYLKMRKNALERSKYYSIDKAAKEQFIFFKKQYRKFYGKRD